jgi:hypothetical protein
MSKITHGTVVNFGQLELGYYVGRAGYPNANGKKMHIFR